MLPSSSSAESSKRSSPRQATEILAARRPGERREQTRVAAFLDRVGAELFPVYELEEYEQVAGGVPVHQERMEL